MLPWQKPFLGAVALVVIAVVVLAGCGGGGSSTTGGSGSSGSTEAEPASGKADVAAAEAAIAPYVGKASPAFPVDEPLKEKPAPDTKIGQLQAATAYGALFAELIGAAGKTAGLEVATTKASGFTASANQSAMQTVLSQNPESIIVPAAEPTVLSKQLKEAGEKNIGLFSAGIMEPKKWGFDGSMLENEQSELAGKLMADWTVAKRGGEADPVFYEFPEVSFNSFEKEGFLAEMEAICTGCEVRTAPIVASEFGTQAPSTIVSDLQSHPDTNEIVMAGPEMGQGLPAALRAAQIEIGIIGFAGEPQMFEYIKNGEMEAALAISAGVQSWTVMDMALRSAEGQELTAGEKKGFTPMQFLAQKDITFDPSLGWASEPEFMKTFAKLWHAE